MDCHLIMNLLSDYLDEELNEELTEQVKTHLVRCQHCAWEAESLRQTISVLQRTVKFPTMNNDFSQKLLEKLLDDHRATTIPPFKPLWKDRKPIYVLESNKEEANGCR